MVEEKQQIKIEVDDEVARGVYSNMAILFHNQSEFIMDFALIHPPKAKVNSRVITSPGHAKSLLKALQNNIAQYEKKYGEIKETEGPDKGLNLKISQN